MIGLWRWTESDRPLQAEKLFRRAIDISRAGQTEETVSPILLNNYAKTLYQLGRLGEAADYAERAYAKAQRSAIRSCSINRCTGVR